MQDEKLVKSYNKKFVSGHNPVTKEGEDLFFGLYHEINVNFIKKSLWNTLCVHILPAN